LPPRRAAAWPNVRQCLASHVVSGLQFRRTMRTSLALVLFACSCADSGAPELSTVDDAVTLQIGAAVDVAVLDNDVGVAAGRVLALMDAPAHGAATLGADGRVHYQADPSYLGPDRVHYTVTNPDGAIAAAAIEITVDCATCADGVSVRLAWDPNAPSDNVLGYRTFLGPSEDPASMVLMDEIRMDRPGFDPTMPTVAYDAWSDLKLRLGDNACFRLKAFNANGESGFSNSACKVVDGSSMRFGL
jgi:hypothetical protein